MSNAAPFDWAARFNDRIRDSLLKKDHKTLIEYENIGSEAHLAVPTPDHYLPLLYAVRLQNDNEPIAFAIDGIEHGSIGMLSVVFGG